MEERSAANELAAKSLQQKLFAAERHISIVRLVLVVFNSFIYLVWMRPDYVTPYLAYSIIVFATSYSIYSVVGRPYEKYAVFQTSYLSTVTDGILTALWIYATGMIESPFYLIWYLSIIGVAMRYSFNEAVFASFTYILLYSAVIFLDDDTPIKGFTIIARLGYIPIAGLFGMYFSREMSDQINDRIKTKIAEEKLKKAKGELELRVQERTAELEDINNDITSSINYAQRIQRSILPSPEAIKNNFDDAFVLYLPKDIISGDFYWFQHDEQSKTCYLAAVDCTGHGVPGALMSILGADLLNQHILEKKEKNLGDILSKIDDSLIDRLKQNSSEALVQDGMEMALCRFTCEEKAKKLSFAGANRPLYLVRNSQLHCIDGTRAPLGGQTFVNEKSFVQHDIEIKEGDLIYLFSDGYVDQFGGENNKKFLRRRLENLLVSSCTLPLNEQKEVMLQELKKWQGENNQTDDILVVGLRV